MANNFVGQGNRGFYVVNGISDNAISKVFNDVLTEVTSAYEFFHTLFGENDFSDDCARYFLNNRKDIDRTAFTNACVYVYNRYGSQVRIMEGKPGYYGNHNAYFHLGEYAPYDSDIKTKNNRYGKFYFPVAYFSRNRLEFWKTSGVDYGRDKYGYYADYIHEVID